MPNVNGLVALTLYIRADEGKPSRTPGFFVYGATHASRLPDIRHPAAYWLRAEADGDLKTALDLRGHGKSRSSKVETETRPCARATEKIPVLIARSGGLATVVSLTGFV